jgi:hypothetical protein
LGTVFGFAIAGGRFEVLTRHGQIQIRQSQNRKYKETTYLTQHISPQTAFAADLDSLPQDESMTVKSGWNTTLRAIIQYSATVPKLWALF